MGASLPELSESVFAERLEAALGSPLAAGVVSRLHSHYEDLRRWNPRLSLIGPGTAGQAVERHYAESLRALPLLPGREGRLVDVGSGGGFPGFVLAAARPDLEVTLVESRQRKWSFLLSATRHAGLSCRCLNARVGPALPEGFPAAVDRVTMRAVRVTEDLLESLRPALAASGSVLLWEGAEAAATLPGWVRGRVVAAGDSARRIVELKPA